MLENSIYSVISPEGCASILWKVEGYDEIAANNLKITSDDLKNLQVIDSIIKEPLGGAHRSPNETFSNLKKELKIVIDALKKKSKNSLVKERRHKYLQFGSNFTI